MVWTDAGRQRAATSIRPCSTSPSSFCCWATAPRSASRRCTPGCRTPTPRARRRSRRCCPGLLLNVALYALLRFKMLLAANPAALAPGPLMVTMGLISLVFAAFMLYRRRDIKRMFAYSSIEHMGIIAFAFGMGGPLANFAGLLHMTMHSLTKSAIFFAVGHIAQVKGTQRIADIGGLTETHPVLGWGLVARRGRDRRPAAARHLHERISGREFDLRARAAARDRCWCSAFWSAFGALFLRLNSIAFGEPRGASAEVTGLLRADVRASRAGAGRRHLSACRARRLVPARREASRIERWRIDSPTSSPQGARVDGHRPWPRVIVDAHAWRAVGERAAAAADAARPLGRDRRSVHMALFDEATRDDRGCSASNVRTGRFPRSARSIRRRIRLRTRHPRSLRP